MQRSNTPRPEQPGCGSRRSVACLSSTAAALPAAVGPREMWSLLRVLAGTHRTHGREVADEVRRTRHQLQPLRGQAADEVQLVALLPVAQGQG